MFAINHAATALLVKKQYPQAPLWLLLISVQATELLWVLFNYFGIEYSTTEITVSSVLDVHLAHMPYSHSIISTLLFAFAAWFSTRRWFSQPKIATATAIAIVSHLLLDLITHDQDIALVPFINFGMFGLGLYSVPLAAFFVETLYGVLCWWIYKGSTLLLATIVLFNLANFTFLNTAVVGPEALLANRPLLLTSLVLVQVLLTLGSVGLLAHRKEGRAWVPGSLGRTKHIQPHQL